VEQNLFSMQVVVFTLLLSLEVRAKRLALDKGKRDANGLFTHLFVHPELAQAIGNPLEFDRKFYFHPPRV